MATLVAVLIGLVAACSDDAGAETTTTTVTVPTTTLTTAAPTTTTAPPTTTTTVITTTAAPTTTTAAPVDAVGNPELLQAAFDEAMINVELSYPDEEVDLAVPDLTNPDPLVAVEEIDAFDQLTARTYPVPEWAQIMGYPGSPIENLLDENLSQLYFNGWLRVRPGDPFVVHDARVVPIDAVDVDPELAEGMPDTAVGVLDRSSSGPVDLVRRGSGEFVATWSEGWDDMRTLTILVPTDAGWRSWAVIVDYQGSS